MSAGRLTSLLFFLLVVHSRLSISSAQELEPGDEGLGEAGLDSTSLENDAGPADLAVDEESPTPDEGFSGGDGGGDAVGDAGGEEAGDEAGDAGGDAGGVAGGDAGDDAGADADVGESAGRGDALSDSRDGLDDNVFGNADDEESEREFDGAGAQAGTDEAQTGELEDLTSTQEEQEEPAGPEETGTGQEETVEDVDKQEEERGSPDTEEAGDASSLPTSQSADDAEVLDEESDSSSASESSGGFSQETSESESGDDEPQASSLAAAAEALADALEYASSGGAAGGDPAPEDAAPTDNRITVGEGSGGQAARSDSAEEADGLPQGHVAGGQDGGDAHGAHAGRRGGHHLGHLNTAAAKQSPREVIQNRYLNPGGGPHGSQSFSIARRAVAVGEHMDVTFDAVVAKTRKHVAPHVGWLARSGYEVAAKTHRGIQEKVSQYVGPEHTPLVSTIVSYVALLTPLLVAALIILRIRAMFSIQKVILFANLYLTAYCATLVLTTCLLGVEPLATLQRSSESNYVVVQLVEAFGYILYLLMQVVNLGIMSASGCCTRFAAVFQICLAAGVGLHYYLNVWQPAMLDLPPSVTWQMYGCYAGLFLACCFMSRVRAVSKTDTETLLVGSDKKL